MLNMPPGFLLGRTHQQRCFSFWSVLMYAPEMIVSPLAITSTRITPSMPQKTVIISFPAEGVVLNFFFLGDCGLCHSIDCFFRLRLIMVSPSFVTCDDPGQKGLPLSIKTLQQFRTEGFPLTSVLGRETSKNPSCAHLRISQYSVALVRERTIQTEWPPPVGEVSANFCG